MNAIAVRYAVILGIAAAAPADVATVVAQDPNGLSSFRRAKAEALLERKLPCLGCHVIGARGGHIGPELSGVGLRLDRVRLRAQIEAPTGLMPRIPLDAATLELLVDYLTQQREPQEKPRPSAATATGSAAPSRAQQLYARHCAACHGATGRGNGWNAPFLDRPPTRHADAGLMGARTDDRLFDAIHAGSAILGGSARMPPFGATLSAEEIRLLVSHIRQLCRCRQPAWAADAR